MLFKKTNEAQAETAAAPAAEQAPEMPDARAAAGPVPETSAHPANAPAQADARPDEGEEDLQRRWEELKTGPFRGLYQQDLDALRGEMESREAKRAAALREERTVREQYPDFSLEEASKDPDFAALLAKDVPMLLAWRAVNHDALVTEAVRRAVQSSGARTGPGTVLPEHAGRDKTPAPQGGARALTKAGREEIARRVLRGEHVSL